MLPICMANRVSPKCTCSTRYTSCTAIITTPLAASSSGTFEATHTIACFMPVTLSMATPHIQREKRPNATNPDSRKRMTGPGNDSCPRR
jgi:hypothetical protein